MIRASKRFRVVGYKFLFNAKLPKVDAYIPKTETQNKPTILTTGKGMSYARHKRENSQAYAFRR